MPRANEGRQQIDELQPDATLTQAAPVQNTWYTILDTTLRVKLYLVVVRVNDTGETLEVRITYGGVAYTSLSVAAVAGNYYFLRSRFEDSLANRWELTATANNVGRTSPITFDSLRIEVRKTTAAGAGNLLGRVIYGVTP